MERNRLAGDTGAMNDLKTTDWIFPWRAKRNLELLRAEIADLTAKNEKMQQQTKGILKFLKIRHGLDMLPRISLKTPIER